MQVSQNNYIKLYRQKKFKKIDKKFLNRKIACCIQNIDKLMI